MSSIIYMEGWDYMAIIIGLGRQFQAAIIKGMAKRVFQPVLWEWTQVYM
jgi:hypothetical protein